MRKTTCLIAALMASIIGCATTSPRSQKLQTIPGQLGVVSSVPKGFRPVESRGSPSAVFVSMDIPAVMEVTEVPLPPSEIPSETSHRAMIDTYAATMTRNPGDVLVSARSLLWNQETHIGAFEVIYTEPDDKLGPVPHVLRVVRIPTKNGTRAIALRKSGAIYDSFNAAWDDILAHIVVDDTAQLGMD